MNPFEHLSSDMSPVETIGLIIGFAILLRVLVAWEDWENARREQERERAHKR